MQITSRTASRFRTLLKPLELILLLALACSAPVLVPTAVPLPIPSPTWTLLPQASPVQGATENPAPPTTAPGEPSATPNTAATEESFSCPGAPEPRVSVGEDAQVTFTDGVPLRIRQTPAVENDNIIAQISEGTAFVITGGPVCGQIPNADEAYIFWEIEIEATGLTGWVAEGDESAYYIETIP